MAGLSSDELYAKIKDSGDCKSLLKKCLSEKMYGDLKDKKTKLNGGLADCIRSGCENIDSGVGLYACDPEAYSTFDEVFDAVIKDYHQVKGDITHPTPDFGNLDDLGFGDLDPEGNCVVSTRVRVGRSHEGYPFPPTLTNAQRHTIAEMSIAALKTLTGELEGSYHPLLGMSPEEQTQLTADHFLFNDSDRFLKAAGGYNNWPHDRGIFFNKNKTFLVWVNEEDHLRLISMQMGGNLGEVYKRLVKAIKTLEQKLTFAKKDNLGYLTFCPTNLGTTMRASVHAKIPKVAAMPEFKAICDKYNIQARGIHGEHTESVGGVYDLSNKRRLGLSEIEAVKEMCEGVMEIIKLEQKQ